MDRTIAPNEFASASPVDLTARPRRRWSDGANYPWSLADEDESAGTHWPTVVALLCEQVARGCQDIEQHIDEPAGAPRDAGEAIRARTSSLRATSMALQQIVRLGSGAIRPTAEPMDLARVARRLAHQRLREFVRDSAEISFDIHPAEALVDGSVADRLMNVSIDWALSFSRRVRLKLITPAGSNTVHLVVRATLPRPSEASGKAGMPRRERRMNDNIHWILLRQLALWAQLPVSRSSTAATESVVIQFPALQASDSTRPPSRPLPR